MEQSKIDMFMMSMNGKFPQERTEQVISKLKSTSDDKFPVLQSLPYKDPKMLLIISILVGSMGIDRFMLGQTGLGIAKLLTCGGLGVWAIIDWFTIQQKAREANYSIFEMNAV